MGLINGSKATLSIRTLQCNGCTWPHCLLYLHQPEIKVLRFLLLVPVFITLFIVQFNNIHDIVCVCIVCVGKLPFRVPVPLGIAQYTSGWIGRKCPRGGRGSLENQRVVRVALWAKGIASFGGHILFVLCCRLWEAEEERSWRGSNVSRREASLSHLKVGRTGTRIGFLQYLVCGCCVHAVRITCHQDDVTHKAHC